MVPFHFVSEVALDRPRLTETSCDFLVTMRHFVLAVVLAVRNSGQAASFPVVKVHDCVAIRETNSNRSLDADGAFTGN